MAKLTTLELRNWQKDVLAEIESHEEKRDSQVCQGMAEYALNKQLGVTIKMPRGAGHTTFANFIANKYPTVLVYGKMDHYKLITSSFPLNTGTETISLYEIFYALYKNPQHPSAEIMDIRNKIKEKKVVVVDNAASVSEDIKNFIYDSAGGIVIMLG
jgi:tRNA A37 threonylcarbamoyladenosine biosynthesis protein TsaE